MSEVEIKEVSKKPKSFNIKNFIIIFITLTIFCCGIFFAISLLFLNKSDNQKSEAEIISDRLFIAKTAIFNEEFSQNFNGCYKFSKISYLDFSSLTQDEIKTLHENFNVSNTMELYKILSDNLKNEKRLVDETIVINNYYFQINHNKMPFVSGKIFGNDDYSAFFDSENNQIFSASLTKLTESELKNKLNNETKTYFNDEMFISTKLSFNISGKIIKFPATLIYKLI